MIYGTTYPRTAAALAVEWVFMGCINEYPPNGWSVCNELDIHDDLMYAVKWQGTHQSLRV